MWFGVVTVFPEMFAAICDYGVVGRALKQQASLTCWNPREFTDDPHRRIDDRPYGGGPGMVMQYPPLAAAVAAARDAAPEPARVVVMSPEGQPFQQSQAVRWAEARQPLVFVAGRYEGMDERVICHCADDVVSLGDYVLSGGELAVMVMVDATVRLLPGVLGDARSAEDDSFMKGLLDHPHYTRPHTVAGLSVPEVLQNGDHSAIAQWRLKQALGRTWLQRPELLEQLVLSTAEQQLLAEFIGERGVAHE